jgi:hypothetical protein
MVYSFYAFNRQHASKPLESKNEQMNTYKINKVQGGSDISGTLSKLHSRIKNHLFY